ncbi:MAG: hypothetical protein JKY26_06775 [Pseudomonas sp.]|nr:hypothetical protein [Pseudomonas sp.]
MAITEERKPYEFLARWDRETGLLAGSHIVFSDAVLRDGVLISETLAPAQPVGDAGFPLQQLLDQVTTDALTAVSALQVEKAALQSEKAELQRQLSERPESPSSELAPGEVTMRQARLALHIRGILPAVQPAIDQLPEPDRTAAQIEWEYSQTVERDRPFVITLCQLLGIADEQRYELFAYAAIL